ncbi:MAG TPA: putative sulfate exporter family transporter [Thermoanaerobaculia bacterium]|nr:putative sulfate exporter family transporter [Thermoanaerobaculia bacterium]
MSAPEASRPFASGPLQSGAYRLLPGILFATSVGLASAGIAAIETRAFGHPVVEGLVIAILLGMMIRALWLPPPLFDAGVSFAAKEILEVAVVLLGASMNLPLLLRAGPALAIGIVLLVIIGLAASYAVGRAMGLPYKLSVLVACGNSICGNSAIAAVAPVIRADKEHVASAIAFTAILGVVVVVGLPFLIGPLGLSHYQYGVLAGLTVYAVPQVLAATFPVSVLSGQVGTLVKLVRVLMLGPVVLFFALRHRNAGTSPDGHPTRFSLNRFVPWFILGFMLLALLRSTGVISLEVAAAAKMVSAWLTLAAMAALGLGVDLKAIGRVGRPVMVTVMTSLILLIVLSFGLIHLLRIR